MTCRTMQLRFFLYSVLITYAFKSISGKPNAPSWCWEWQCNVCVTLGGTCQSYQNKIISYSHNWTYLHTLICWSLNATYNQMYQLANALHEMYSIVSHQHNSGKEVYQMLMDRQYSPLFHWAEEMILILHVLLDSVVEGITHIRYEIRRHFRICDEDYCNTGYTRHKYLPDKTKQRMDISDRFIINCKIKTCIHTKDHDQVTILSTSYILGALIQTAISTTYFGKANILSSMEISTIFYFKFSTNRW